MSYFKLGEQFIMEPPEPLTCIQDCPFGKETQTECATGPKVRAEVTGLMYGAPDGEPVLLVTPIARLCMREVFEGGAQDMPPVPPQ